MTPQEFITKWSASERRERAHAQEHFIDLCNLLAERTPGEGSNDFYTFEKGVPKTGGGNGWADVWKRGCFAWEYKSHGKDLNTALKQLQYYVRSLENPPLLIVSDMERIELHTNWTNTVQEVYTLTLPELADARRRQILKKAFSATEVEELKPGKTREALTKEVAQEFVRLAQNLRERGHDPEKVAHFVNRMVFCMFAEDVDLLPDNLFKRMLEASLDEPESFAENAQKLFAAMARQGGRLDFRRIEWFNGGIFDDDTALPLTKEDIRVALAAANRNWSNIDPSIMGTLFERGLDPGKRSQLGAHYTDPDKIMLIVNPVIVEPLTREWEEIKSKIAVEMAGAHNHKSKDARTKAENRAKRLKAKFIERLKNFRVLDPACGSGNFLYLALKELKNIEHRVNVECEQMGLPRDFPVVGPECVKGIEINPFAAELARVSVWIGEIQWMREHGFDASRNPILKPLENIVRHDALLNDDGTEYGWPEADVIIGNPPFLGGVKIRGAIGDQDYDRLRKAYDERVPAAADLVTYWCEKAASAITEGLADKAGLVTTNAIRGGGSRFVLERIIESALLFEAWSDMEWTVEGADVRVSTICFSSTSDGAPAAAKLDGMVVDGIHADLTAGQRDLTKARLLRENDGCAFQGSKKIGPFEIAGEMARSWIAEPRNPNKRSNADVIRPSWIAIDVVRSARDVWIIDFGLEMSEVDAALYEAPFKYVRENIWPLRKANNRETRKRYWWRHGDGQPAMRAAVSGASRFIVTPEVSKHRIFRWAPSAVLPDCKLMVIARDDDTTFGILGSRYHAAWSLRVGSWHGVGNDPRYTPTTCFQTFPFPEGLTPNIPAADYANDPRAIAIAKAAARLNELRENWLNPSDLVKRVPEVVPTAEQREAGAKKIYPDRILPIDDKATAILKKRTLTNLYNERPAWLDNAHRDLDAAVAAAYGWPADLTDEQILERLFALNQQRAAAQ